MKRILCIGDSNTWGYDPRSFSGSRYPEETRWTGRLLQAGYQVINCEENGASIPGVRLFPVMKRYLRVKLPADLITVMLGSNDLLGGATAKMTAKRMEEFLSFLSDLSPDSKLLLIAPPVLREGEWVTSPDLIAESSELSGMYRELADRREICFSDAEDWKVEVLFDGVHFSPGGHRTFADNLKNRMTEIIGA